MPIYSMQAPNGKTYDIEGPDGATEDQVRAEILRRDPYATHAPTPSSGFTPGETEPKSIWQHRLEEAQGERPGLDSDNEFGGPRVFDNGISNPLSTVRDIADVGARGFEYLTAGTNTALDYIDEASRSTGIADALSVGGNKFLPGTAIGALMEAFPSGGISEGLVRPVVGTKPSTLAPEAEALRENLFRTGTVEDIMSQAPDAATLDRAAVERFVAERDAGAPIDTKTQYVNEPIKAVEGEMGVPGEIANEGEVGIPGPQFKQKSVEEAAAPEAKPVEQEYVPSQIEKDIAEHADALTGQWKNAPEVQIYDHFDDAEGIDPGSLGVYDPESGKVLLNSKGIEREAAHRKLSVQEMTNTVLFHEGLGHHGLAQQFRGDLDAALTKWYNSSTWFKREVTRWIEKNADAYADENQIARAGEEVLAELSEAGKMPAKLMDQIKNQIKDYARKLGMDLEFSAREIRTILAQSHEAVVSGKKYDVRGNGFRSMKATYGESEGSVQGRAGRENKEGDTSVIHKVRSNRQIDEILDEADVEKTKETWGEWQSDADRIKMTTAMAEKLAAGTSPAELIAAEKHAAKLANTISDLSHKAANQTLSPKETDLLKQHIRHLDTTAQAISDVVSNAARILNARKMEIATDETVVQRLLRRMSSSEIEALATPEGARKFALQLARDQKKAARIEKAVNVLGNILNFTRAIWSSWDLSAPFRQARALAHTGDFWKNMPNMFKYWGDKNFYNMTMDSIKERPTYSLMKKHGLAFTELGSDLSKREEAFMSTWAEKIPGVRQSERAYNGYLNKLRADTFDTMYKKLDDTGIDFNSNPKALKDLTHFINNATGRGNLDLGKFGPVAAGVLFSPRLMASRVQMLNPMYYAKLSPGVRAQAIKSMIAFGTTSVMFAKLMQAAGMDVEYDPRSSDFMKLKKGNTRYDMLGGYGQYATLYSRLITNQKKNAKGDVVELGKRFGSKDAYDVLGDFVRSKFSPNMSLVVDARLGKNVVGEEFDSKKETIKRFVPMIMQDLYKQVQEDGAVGVAKTVPGVFGVGVQTYPGPSGTDVYGRSYEAEREDTPAITEMKRIEETLGKSPINPPKKKIGDRQLTDEEYNEYQKLAGEWTTQTVEQEMQTEEWAQMSDEEKFDLIRDIAKDMRENARDELFSDK